VIRTEYWLKPIPDRRWDWLATEEDYDEGRPIGHGRTENEAIADLLELLAEEENEECTCRTPHVRITDIDPPAYKSIRDKWCPIHGKDPDEAYEEMRDRREE